MPAQVIPFPAPPPRGSSVRRPVAGEFEEAVNVLGLAAFLLGDAVAAQPDAARRLGLVGIAAEVGTLHGAARARLMGG